MGKNKLNEIQIDLRNRAIIRMIAKGLSLRETARIFLLSPSFIKSVWDASTEAQRDRF